MLLFEQSQGVAREKKRFLQFFFNLQSGYSAIPVMTVKNVCRLQPLPLAAQDFVAEIKEVRSHVLCGFLASTSVLPEPGVDPCVVTIQGQGVGHLQFIYTLAPGIRSAGNRKGIAMGGKKGDSHGFFVFHQLSGISRGTCSHAINECGFNCQELHMFPVIFVWLVIQPGFHDLTQNL